MTSRIDAFGGQSMVEPLRSVLVRKPDRSFGDADPERWHYAGRPDLQRAVAEHALFVEILRGAGVVVHNHAVEQPDRADSIYLFDPALMTNRGAILLRMGKPLRRGEEQALGMTLSGLGIPILHTVTAGRVEGGDLLWLREDLLAVGLGFRTDRTGLEQIAGPLNDGGIRILPVELPYHGGPDACLHLLSLISVVDHNLAVVYRPLLSVAFLERVEALGFQLIDVPDEEFATMGPNILALAPGKCLMLEGNPVTRGRLEEAGCEVLVYRGEEISLKAEGGPTCLTRPILRSAM